MGAMCGGTLLDFECAELASHIERSELHIRGGKQDHYASALGGMNYMEFFGETVRTARVPLAPSMRMYLEKHLLLVYTGKSRLSGDIHSHVWGAFRSGQPQTVNAIERLKQIARRMKDSLMAGDCNEVAELLNENWTCQKALHPSVTNEQLDDLFQLAVRSGAKGGKACGAGGGGCVLLLAEAEREHVLRRAMENVPGVSILPFTFPLSGLAVARFERVPGVAVPSSGFVIDRLGIGSLAPARRAPDA
jgi:D-glycero-alpha-D-manno-heptose-7-phosphate kinase